MNILEELYYGNIRPSEKCFDRQSKYAAFLKIIAENEEKLSAILSTNPDRQEEQNLFTQLMNAQTELSVFGERDRFIEGFQLGVRFMVESYILPEQSVIRDIR